MRRFDAIWFYDTDFTDKTDGLSDGSAPQVLAAGEKLYFGYRDWLSGIYFNISIVPSTADLVPEMYDGVSNTWKVLPTRETYTQLQTGHSIDVSGYNFDTDGVVYWSFAQWQWTLKKAVDSSFPELVGTVPSDDALYWVRLRNAGANPVTIDRALPLPYNTYVTHQEMANFMGLPEFNEVNDPIQTTVRNRLRAAEDWLDNYARSTWRIKPYFNERVSFNPYGFVVKHRPIITVTRLGLWNGSSFQLMTEGRNKEWFTSPEKGMIYFTLPSFRLRYYSFLLSRYLRQPDSVEFDYVAGADFDIHDQRGVVRDIILYKAGADLVRQLDWTVILVNNPDAVPKVEKARQWEELATTYADELRAPLVA